MHGPHVLPSLAYRRPHLLNSPEARGFMRPMPDIEVCTICIGTCIELSAVLADMFMFPAGCWSKLQSFLETGAHPAVCGLMSELSWPRPDAEHCMLCVDGSSVPADILKFSGCWSKLRSCQEMRSCNWRSPAVPPASSSGRSARPSTWSGCCASHGP